MRTVNYSEVLQLLSELMGIPYADLPTATALTYRGAISRWFRKAWEVEYWPELTRVDERHYRLEYSSGTTYAAPTTTSASEVWYSPTQTYYQALRSTLNNAPATLSGTTYTTNASYWAACASSYSGSDWLANTAYNAGTVVRRPSDNRFYQFHSGTFGDATFPTSHTGVLTPLDKYVGYAQTGFTDIGDVRDVYSKDPRVEKTYATANWTLSQNGVQVPNGPSTVWLEYRTRFVPLTGADYSASATYAVGDQILFNSAGSVKNFYTCTTATSAGESPNTAAAKWTLIEIPYIFQPYLVTGAYADCLLMDGQNDKAAQQTRLAESYLETEAAKLFNLQPQQQRMDMSAAY